MTAQAVFSHSCRLPSCGRAAVRVRPLVVRGGGSLHTMPRALRAPILDIVSFLCISVLRLPPLGARGGGCKLRGGVQIICGEIVTEAPLTVLRPQCTIVKRKGAFLFVLYFRPCDDFAYIVGGGSSRVDVGYNFAGSNLCTELKKI